MGSCTSRPENCVGGGKKAKKLRKKRRAAAKRRASSRLYASSSAGAAHSFDVINKKVDSLDSNGRASVDDTWFDSAAILESDCSDDDFQSISDDVSSQNESEAASRSSISSLRDANHRIGDVNVPYSHHSGQPQKQEEYSAGHSAHNPVSDTYRSAVHRAEQDSRLRSDGTSNDKSVYVDETSSVEGSGGRGDNLLDNCGIIPNNCLPCLASTVPTVEKRRSFSTSPTHTKKKAAHKLSFKWKEGHSSSSLLSSKMLIKRPIAGSQVPFCPADKKMPDSWSQIAASTFRVRGENYLRDKKKDLAPSHAAYNPFGVDVYLSQRKIDHIARFVGLPNVSSYGELPPILVVNCQIPLYPAALFQSETDGEGINIVLYFKLSESYSKELPSHCREGIQKLISDEVEKVKGSSVPFRERLKILGRVVNVDDLQLSAAERKLMHAYNEKPVLSRPQHEFYLGENYLEIDLDMHRFGYISRKGFGAFLDRLKHCILDFGLTIQGNKPEELPEQILCCVRINEIDYSNYQKLGLSQESP
ncbi:uncharacterized protein LOC141672606 [Apium graveolens]|uniref:uncharacterized protein LOC141672606 n=1 Tax=Apium graveolens TaxID=4045 RepID=UPI003D7B7458